VNAQREALMNTFSRGSLAHMDFVASSAIDFEKPCGVSLDMIKPRLALFWLKRPEGFFARLVWALRLAWRK